MRLSSALLERVAYGVRDPLKWTGLIQLSKTVVAAVAAWVIAYQVLQLPQAFLAPWSALLVVHSTVYRTFSRGLRATGAVLGVLLAWAVGNLVGLSTVAVSVLLLVGLVLGSLRWFRDESTVVAATGLIVLTTGQSRESGLLNLRRAARSVRSADVHEEVLRHNEQAIAECRSMARTIGHGIENIVEWEPSFREPWLALLQEAGEAIGVPNSARVVAVRRELVRLAEDLSLEDLSERHWPEYGALIMNLRNVAASMDRVAQRKPLVLPPLREA